MAVLYTAASEQSCAGLAEYRIRRSLLNSKIIFKKPSNILTRWLFLPLCAIDKILS
jgi:hypothetical protein